MKAISIRQPWASLIMLGIKEIETRSKTTRFRGRVAIHASQRLAVADEKSAAGWALLAPHGITPENATTGAVLGTIEIFDTRKAEESVTFLRGTSSGERQLSIGDYEAGRHGWLLREPAPFARPVAATGALSFWTWTR